MPKYVRWPALAAGALAFSLAGWLAAVVPKTGGNAANTTGTSVHQPAVHRPGLAGREEVRPARGSTCPGHSPQPHGTVVACPIAVTTTSLPTATLGARYAGPKLAVSGGTPPYTWRISDRWLPPGLSLSPAGAISGSPALAGTFHFTVRATDSAGDSDSASMSLTVGGCTTTITGMRVRPLAIGSGVTCLNQATISGPIAIPAGAVLSIQGSTLDGPLYVHKPARLAVCGTTINGPTSVTGATGPVVLGGARGTPCPADTITGLVTFSGDAGGATLSGATISGPVHVAGNTGPVNVSANTVGGPVSVTGNTGGTVVAGNSVSGSLSCSGNKPAPTDHGKPNAPDGPAIGQCSHL